MCILLSELFTVYTLKSRDIFIYLLYMYTIILYLHPVQQPSNQPSSGHRHQAAATPAIVTMTSATTGVATQQETTAMMTMNDDDGFMADP